MTSSEPSEAGFRAEVRLVDGGEVAIGRYALPAAAQLGPLVDQWLSPEEASVLGRLRSPVAARAWLGGRVAIKQALVWCGRVDVADAHRVSIRSRTSGGKRDRPTAWLDATPLEASLSLTHDEQMAIAAIGAGSATVGVDTVRIADATASVEAAWFTPAEKRLCSGRRTRRAIVWAVKEAAYKAIQRGEPFRPLRLEASLEAHGHWRCACDTGERMPVDVWRPGPGRVAALARARPADAAAPRPRETLLAAGDR
ncbi:4'-phosphopantetheinyl transferase superfamily protein [Botrimarina sp.]|uniref:4'-phosphopantetheinyl transferase superfamily protein n=1 Tax=Botrimarina sp. TaxID=2795802 RepID=UPI0032EF1F56